MTKNKRIVRGENPNNPTKPSIQRIEGNQNIRTYPVNDKRWDITVETMKDWIIFRKCFDKIDEIQRYEKENRIDKKIQAERELNLLFKELYEKEALKDGKKSDEAVCW